MDIKKRMKNPVWWIQMFLAILTPITAYYGITNADITSWTKLGQVLLDAISNPNVLYCVFISVWSALYNPTTPGLIRDNPKRVTKTPEKK